MKKSKQHSIQHLLLVPFKFHKYVEKTDQHLDKLGRLEDATEEQRIDFCRQHLQKVVDLANRDLEKVLSYTQYMKDTHPQARVHVDSQTIYFDGLSELEVEECCELEPTFEHLEFEV